MEKTIKERAKESVHELYNCNDCKMCSEHNTPCDCCECGAGDYLEGYIAGATEQKAIDEEGIEKAYNAGYAKAIDNVCEWLECNTDKYHWVNWIQEKWGDDVNKLIRDLKKAMEQ